MQETGFSPCVGTIPWRMAWQPTLVFRPGESPWTKGPGGLQSTESQSQTQLNDQHAEVTEKGYQKELKHRTTTIRKTVFKNNKLY